MAAKKNSGARIQIIALTQIIASPDIQSRVETDKSAMKEFSDAWLNGADFPPITVFFDGKVFWLADGFHRFGAAVAASVIDKKLRGIKSDVREGTKRDAIIFSTSANQRFSLRRKPEDLRRACEMLFADEEWGVRATAVIARHVGLNKDTAQRYRVSYHHRTKTQFPEIVIREDGREASTVKSHFRGNPLVKEAFHRGRRYYFAKVDGKTIHLGTDEFKAKENLDRYVKDKKQRSDHLNASIVRSLLTSNRIPSEPISKQGALGEYLFGTLVGTAFVTWWNVSEDDNLATVVGRVALSVAFKRLVGRRIVLCHLSDMMRNGPQIALARSLGIEFLTPEEFLASYRENNPGPEPEAV